MVLKICCPAQQPPLFSTTRSPFPKPLGCNPRRTPWVDTGHMKSHARRPHGALASAQCAMGSSPHQLPRPLSLAHIQCTKPLLHPRPKLICRARTHTHTALSTLPFIHQTCRLYWRCYHTHKQRPMGSTADCFSGFPLPVLAEQGTMSRTRFTPPKGVWEGRPPRALACLYPPIPSQNVRGRQALPRVP